MKELSFKVLEKKINYNDYTGFVYDDGTQVIYSGHKITEDSLQPFNKGNNIHICNMGELPKIKKQIEENLLAEFEPAAGVSDDGYEQMKKSFQDNKGEIACVKNDGATTYMLVW